MMKFRAINLFRLPIHWINVLIWGKEYFKGKWVTGNWEAYIWGLQGIINQKILRRNAHVPFPCSPMIHISNPENIIFDKEDLHNFQGIGKYYQANSDATISIFSGTYIANGVGIITTNHNLNDPSKYQKGRSVIIRSGCWIGMNAVILPGVLLGEHTIVGAGSIVTKSFPNGHQVIAGNPAKVIRLLTSDKERAE